MTTVLAIVEHLCSMCVQLHIHPPPPPPSVHTQKHPLSYSGTRTRNRRTNGGEETIANTKKKKKTRCSVKRHIIQPKAEPRPRDSKAMIFIIALLRAAVQRRQ